MYEKDGVCVCVCCAAVEKKSKYDTYVITRISTVNTPVQWTTPIPRGQFLQTHYTGCDVLIRANWAWYIPRNRPPAGIKLVYNYNVMYTRYYAMSEEIRRDCAQQIRWSTFFLRLPPRVRSPAVEKIERNSHESIISIYVSTLNIYPRIVRSHFCASPKIFEKKSSSQNRPLQLWSHGFYIVDGKTKRNDSAFQDVENAFEWLFLLRQRPAERAVTCCSVCTAKIQKT